MTADEAIAELKKYPGNTEVSALKLEFVKGGNPARSYPCRQASFRIARLFGLCIWATISAVGLFRFRSRLVRGMERDNGMSANVIDRNKVSHCAVHGQCGRSPSVEFAGLALWEVQQFSKLSQVGSIPTARSTVPNGDRG